MSLFNLFNTVGSALNAQTIRLNTTASNLANAESVNGDSSKIYRARHPVFQTMMDTEASSFDEQDAGVGVKVLGIVESTAPPLMRYQPRKPGSQQGRLRVRLKRQLDRGDGQHDLGQPCLLHQCGCAQHRARPVAQDNLDGTLIMLINGNYATGNTGTGTGTGTGTTGTGTTGNTTGTGSTGSTDTTGADSSGGVNGAATLGGANFLTLMLAQLKNQDPTSPVDSNTFLTQLAQLAQVQGINSLNTAFSSLSGSITGNQALQASSLLGHQVLVASGSATTASAGAAVSGAVSVPQTTAGVTVSISDASGALVKTLTLGAHSSGFASFTWDGTENNGSKAPAGAYTLTAQYAGQTKQGTAASTYVNGTVESVSMGGSSNSAGSTGSGTTTTGMTLNVAGVGSVPFSSVQQISN